MESFVYNKKQILKSSECRVNSPEHALCLSDEHFIDFWPRNDAGSSFAGIWSESQAHIGSSERKKKKKKEKFWLRLFWLRTAAFPCRWLIQVQRGGRGGIRLWALSVNHTALPHRRHLSPNSKGCAPQGTLKPISPLTCNPSRPRKNRIVESYHIHFLCEGTFRGERTAGTEVVWRDFRMRPWKVPIFFQMTFTFLNWLSCFAAAFQLPAVGIWNVNLITSIISTSSSGVMKWNIVPLLFLLIDFQNWSMGCQHLPLPPSFTRAVLRFRLV